MVKNLNFHKTDAQRNIRLTFIKIGLSMLIFTLVAEIWVANGLSTYGMKLTVIDNKMKNLQLENQVLENEIAQRGSYNQVFSKASQLGFTDEKNFEYIDSFNLASVIK